MTHDVFISYSSKDKLVADEVCTNLEKAAIRCWIAPRNIAPGEDWRTAITQAISQSQVFVFISSVNSNSSDHVSREISLADDHKVVIIPFKIDHTGWGPSIEYILAKTQWLDASNPPTREQINALVDRIRSILPMKQNEEIKETSTLSEVPVQPLVPPSKKTRAGKSRSHRQWLWIIGIVFIILSLAGWFISGKIPEKKAVLETKTFISPTLDFSAKIKGFGATLFEGPGGNYPVIEQVLADVKIIAKAEGCEWLAVTTSTNGKTGWIKADQLTFSVACEDIPPAQIPPTPTLDYTAKIWDRGVPLYEGPGDTYPVIGIVLADVQIVGQTDECKWLKVDSRAFKRIGWLEADKMNYSVSCADISALP
jgi:hypothetical protein